MTNPNDSVYPQEQTTHRHADTPNTMVTGGLTKKEYFAALAMQAYQMRNGKRGQTTENVEVIARRSVEQADALFNALNKTKHPGEL